MFLPYILSKASGSCSPGPQVGPAGDHDGGWPGLWGAFLLVLRSDSSTSANPSQAESAPFKFKLLGVRASSRTSFTRHVVTTGDV